MYLDKKQLYISNVLRHHSLVVELMYMIEMNKDQLSFEVEEFSLIQRAVRHDTDKIETKFVNFVVGQWVLDIKTDEERKELRGRCGTHDHYETQSHHTPYHILRNSFPDNIDICEMCCDWVASSQKSYNRDVQKQKFKNLKEKIFNEKYREIQDFIRPQINKFYEVIDLLEKLIKETNFNLSESKYDFPVFAEHGK